MKLKLNIVYGFQLISSDICVFSLHKNYKYPSSTIRISFDGNWIHYTRIDIRLALRVSNHYLGEVDKGTIELYNRFKLLLL